MNDLIPLVTERDGVPVTTSRAVAEQFGKAHKNVLRDIETTVEQLSETEEGRAFTERNFAPSVYRDSTGRELPAYLLTRDGFTLLAMGFTGAKAMAFKVAYINAFDRMEALLRGQAGLSSGALQNIERRLEALEASAGIGQEEASKEVAAIFLQALQDAIDGGGYYLRPKNKSPAEKTTGRLLGIYDRHEITLKAWQAYTIYEAATSSPMSIRALWEVLERAGTIYPRAEVGKTRSFNGKRSAALILDRDKLNEGSNNHEEH